MEEFAVVDAECIIQSTVGEFLDIRIRHYRSKGKFTIRSTYGVAVARSVEASSFATETGSGNRGNWDFIWATKVPPKV
ncbi:UNVERIFIED_CONTAM: hypothetical protein Sradi_3289800 [Sesamum radiatum]|uniref:Uncharacterized protein n=1 Tax=Sesamum radiatum TaxID=300843 RepID=A0AAW2R1E5_SESRA